MPSDQNVNITIRSTTKNIFLKSNIIEILNIYKNKKSLQII